MSRGSLCVLSCYVMWGLLPVFWKQLAEVDSLYVLATRAIWAFLFTGLALALRRDNFAALRKVWHDAKERKQLAVAGLAICANWGLYIWAVSHDRILDSSLATYLNPILAIALGAVLFRERLSRMRWLAVVIAFAGFLIATFRYGQIPWLALAISVTFTLYGTIKKSVSAESVTATFFETLILMPAAIALVVWMELQGTGAIGVLSGWQWLLLPMSGVVTGLPLILFSAGLKSTPMTLAGILMYINPTLQLLVSVLIYHEPFTMTHVILFAFVWAGLALYVGSGFAENRKKEEKQCE